MCEPTTIAAMSFALSAATTAVGYVGQMQQASAQEQMYQQNRESSIKSMELGWTQNNNRIMQEREAAALEKANAARETRAAEATAKVAAAEAGVSGLSVDQLLGDINGNYGRYASGIDTQTDWTVSQLQMEQRGVRAAGIDRINSAPRGRKPSLFGAALQIGAAGLGYATDLDRIKRQGYA